MSTLADIYAVMLQKYGKDFTLTFSAVPSYLKQIVGPQDTVDKIILLYHEDRDRLKKMYIPLSLKKEAECKQDLNLTGSPLKDEGLMDDIEDMAITTEFVTSNPWNTQEESHIGIHVERARNILSEISLQCVKEKAQAVGSIWLLCQGKSPQYEILYQYQVNPEYNSRGIVTFKGLVQPSSIHIDDIIHQHYSGTYSYSKTECLIENTYSFQADTAITCSWNSTDPHPALIDLSSCDVVLTQTFRTRNSNHLARYFLEQLKTLVTIYEDIIVYKKGYDEKFSTICKEPIYRCETSADIGDLNASITNAMTGIASVTDVKGIDIEWDIETTLEQAQRRPLTDITDRLWNILIQCSSFKDLRMAFGFVFKCAAKCNIVNTPTNSNRLADIIMDLINHRLSIPRLSGSEPLELLLEIGIEKLYRDYDYIFAESKMCSGKDLRSIKNSEECHTKARRTLLHSDVQNAAMCNDDSMIFKISNFSSNEASRQLARLLQIHFSLEHLLMIQINLNLKGVYGDICDQLLKKPTQKLSTFNDSLADRVDLSLSAHDVNELLFGRDPYNRRITLNSQSKFRSARSTFYYSMENVCPPGISENFEIEEKEMSKDSFYYCWLYRNIKTGRPTNIAAK